MLALASPSLLVLWATSLPCVMWCLGASLSLAALRRFSGVATLRVTPSSPPCPSPSLPCWTLFLVPSFAASLSLLGPSPLFRLLPLPLLSRLSALLLPGSPPCQAA